ncbi:Protein of unknown function [Pyronema omphalodes CBS 100304]|uniref:Uncharacterized protein n=1 Tax=Pyronema omphalodes (strain CBS 100304) TaxID=1076935 RepID=U4L9P9_PYROM|nr:Protein of unknown function [Pyronema omphalodes CBS 100304]
MMAHVHVRLLEESNEDDDDRSEIKKEVEEEYEEEHHAEDGRMSKKRWNGMHRMQMGKGSSEDVFF